MAEKTIFRVITITVEMYFRNLNSPPDLDEIISECLNLNSSYNTELETESETEAYKELKRLSKYNTTYFEFLNNAKKNYAGTGYISSFELALLNEVVVDADGDEIEFISEDYCINRIISEWDAIASYMNDNIRESLHNELTQWTEKEFLQAYFELEKNYKGENLKSILENEFNITEKDLNDFLNS